MKSYLPGGLLVAVEGIDGAGKTTVAVTLAQWCGERGLLCAISKEPTSLETGQRLRESANSGRLSLAQELELFHKDREEHVERSIRPALEEGAVMILDRYYWSTAAYQGARGASVREIVEYNEAHFPVPDLVLLLDVPVEIGQRRIRVRGDHPNAFEDSSALEKCRKIFKDLPALSQSGRSCLVDASKSWRVVVGECLRHFRQGASQKLWKTADPRTPPSSETLRLFEN